MEIADWLQGLGLGQYAPAFAAGAVGWDVLPQLTASDLRELGVIPVGDRRRLLRAIAALPPPEDAPPRADAAERRHVSVMFCDLVGSTALSVGRDPEDLREIIGAYHRAVAATVRGFSGFVAKYMGDGVLVYFGYPQAHEDDAERAVRAGLAVIGAVGRLAVAESLAVRVGIASGLVVVGDLIGEGAAQERGAMGETPNLAARLQALAPPNRIVIAESTRRQLGALFDVEDLGPQTLAGFTDPKRAWCVVRESAGISRFEALRPGGTQFVGRDAEMALLLRQWHEAAAEGGRVVLVSGEPGIGKSRLMAALAAATGSGARRRLRWFCSPHHQDSALYPFIVHFERRAGFAREDSAAVRLAKLDAVLAPGEPGDAELLRELISLPNAAAELSLSPSRLRERLLEALLRQGTALARKRPLLAVFEDAHWCDPTSRELLEMMIARIGQVPVLLAITFRPEFQTAWGRRDRVSRLELGRLGESEVAALVRGVAGAEQLGREIVSEIVERTDGVPLFVEELTKAVLERADRADGIAAVLSASPLSHRAVPPMLHASLVARLDRIGDAARHVAQVGSVLGREFSYDLIEPVARLGASELGAGLERLTEAELLFCHGAPPHSTYLFKHALVQDAAYSTLLRTRRAQLHGLAGRVLEARFPAIAETQPELLARHFAEAGDAERAIGYWQRAGERALQRSANAEASAHLRAGIAAIGGLPPSAALRRTELALQMALGSATRAIAGHGAEATLHVYSRARALLDDTVPARQQMAVLYGLWTVDTVRAEYLRGQEVAEQALAIAGPQDDPEATAYAGRMMGLSRWVLGDLAAARRYLEPVVTLYQPGSGNLTDLRYSQDHAIFALSVLALVLWPLGFPDQAAAAAARSLGWARDLDHTMTTGFALWTGSALNGFCGTDVLGDGAHAEAALAYCVDRDLHAYVPFSQFYRGQALVWGDQAESGMAMMRGGIEAAGRISFNLLGAAHLGHLAAACAARGDPAQGLAVVDQAIARAEVTGERVFEAELHRLRGEMLGRSDGAAAAAALRRALDIARAQQARMWELRAALALARLWAAEGRRTEARELLAPVHGWFTEGHGTADLMAAKAMLNTLS